MINNIFGWLYLDKTIDIVTEVTQSHFMARQVNNYSI
jgi:hypothetical protein